MYDAESKGAIQYIQLAEEVLENEKLQKHNIFRIEKKFFCSHD